MPYCDSTSFWGIHYWESVMFIIGRRWKIITLAVDEGGVMDDTLDVWNGPVNCVIVVIACEVGAPFTAS
jgi:hypothetical protein